MKYLNAVNVSLSLLCAQGQSSYLEGRMVRERHSRCLQVRHCLVSCKTTTSIYVCKFRIPSSENENYSLQGN